MRSLLGFLSSLALVLGAPAALSAEPTGIEEAPAAGPAESTPAPAPAPAKRPATAKPAPAKAAPAKAPPAKAAPAKSATPAPAAPAPAPPKAPAPAPRTDAEPVPPPPPAAGVPSADNEPEETFPEPKAGVVSASTLNIRTSPSIDKSQIVTALKRGRQLSVVGRKGKWLKIELPSDIALWVMTKYVTLPQNAPLPAAGVINADSVRVRTGGDQKAPILKQVELDTQVEVLEKAGEWMKIKAPAGTYGWAFGNYVKTDGTEVAVAPPGGGDPAEKPPVAPDTGEKPPPTTVETPETGTPTAPEVVKGPGVEAFAEAETAYRQAQADKEPDLVPVFLMYHKAAGTPGVPAAVKNKCDQRMAEIAKGMPDAQKKKVEAEVKRGIEAQLAAIRAAADAAKAQIPRVAPVYTAVGFVDRAPDVPGIPGTHKLGLSGVLLYYLRPAADGLDLDRFEGHRVGVVGRKRFVKGWSIEVIDVVDMRDYQDVPSTSSRLEVEP